MLEVTVSARGQGYEVRLPNYTKLTPQSARAAGAIAFGAAASCTVIGDGKIYRITARSCRRIRPLAY